METFETVVIYLSTIIGSVIFVFFSESEYRRKRYVTGMMLAGIAVLIPCIIASLRDITVGVDIEVYILPNFRHELTKNGFISYYHSMGLKTDFLFALLLFLFSKYGSIGGLFFAIELLSIVPVYYVLHHNKEKGSVTFGMFLFLIMFYNVSLCVMRGCISQAFLFLAYYLQSEKKRTIKALLCAVIAILFHSTALLPLLFYALCILFNKHGWKRKDIVIFIIGLLIFFVFYRQIISGLTTVIGKIEPRYASRIKKYLLAQEKMNLSDISYGDFISKLVILFIGVYYSKILRVNKKSQIRAQLAMASMGRYLSAFSVNFYESIRIGFFFDYALLLYVPNSIKKLSQKRRVIVYTGIFFIMLAYWYFMYIISNSFKTNPYIFRT